MKIAVISAILEEPTKCNAKFNEVISAFREKSKRTNGIPLEQEYQ